MSQETNDQIIMGMAELFWGDAYGDHVEEHDCYNLSGRDIVEVMPTIPKLAMEAARKLAMEIEKANGCNLASLYNRAMDADRNDPSILARAKRISSPNKDLSSPIRFGNCLAYKAQGAGISWFDDHARFDLKVPHDAGEIKCLLQEYAAEHCDNIDESKRIRCIECGYYNDPDKDRCGNCSKNPKSNSKSKSKRK